MKTYQPILTTSIETAAGLAKHLFVGFDGALCAANAKALGVCEADAGAGKMAPVNAAGIALVLSGGAISAGAPVASNAAGKAVAASNLAVTIPVDDTAVTSDAAQPTLAVSGSVTPQAINGYALDAADGADELIRIKLV